MVNSTAPMIAHGRHPPQRPRFFRDGTAFAGGGPEGDPEVGSLGGAAGGGGAGGGVSPVEAPVGLMLFTWSMITKKRLLASAALAMLGAWTLTQAAGQAMMAPASPAPKFGASLGDAGASGTVGPNLDEAKPDAALVTDRVTNGKGAMPSFKGQLSPEQIEAVAEYVSQSAGG